MKLRRYDAARSALANCLKIDEALSIRDDAERMKFYARQAKDRELLADAAEIHLRAERRLGELLHKAKDAGHIRGGRPKKDTVRLDEIGVDRKLSMKAQKCAQLALDHFEEMVADLRARIVSGAATLIETTRSTKEKQARRANREAALGAVQCALPNKKYGVILADPEWRFEPWSRETGLDRAADNHYPTSCTEVIAARDVPSIAADDCVLFLWATVPMLPHALTVMAAWGFDYVSGYVWDKLKAGTGYWGRSRVEHLLIGTKGNVPCPASGTQLQNLICLPATEHSAKPEGFLEMIEQYFPTLPKIELNRRGAARIGWARWGNEATEQDAV